MNRLERLAAALAVVTTRPPIAMASTPLELRNPLNGSGGTTKGARYATNARRKKERRAGAMLASRLLNSLGHQSLSGGSHCVVLTRISPKAFDSDNNEAALKSVRDGMAEAWGIDDADPRVTWVCDWRKGKHHVVEAALWVVPAACLTPERHIAGKPYATCETCAPAPSQPEFDADDHNGRPRVVVHGGLIQRREVRRDAWADIRSDSRKPVITPAYIRAKGGL